MRHRVMISAPYMRPAFEHFRAALAEQGVDAFAPAVDERLEEHELLALVGDVDGVICGDDRFTRRVLESAPRLRVISKWGTGVDSIDRAACDALGVRLCNTPNAFTIPVADSTFAYMLAFARRTFEMDAAMREGAWEKLPGRSLAESTLGVIGVGNIGREVARRARAFGMRVLGCDRVAPPPEFVAASGIEMTTLERVLRESDFVSLHADLNATSRHLINANTLRAMKPTAVVINASRGPLIHEAALVDALEAGRLGGAGLDVFEVEPLPADSPLRRSPRALLAPHNANSSPAAWERVHANTIRNLLIGLKEVQRWSTTTAAA